MNFPSQATLQNKSILVQQRHNAEDVKFIVMNQSPTAEVHSFLYQSVEHYLNLMLGRMRSSVSEIGHEREYLEDKRKSAENRVKQSYASYYFYPQCEFCIQWTYVVKQVRSRIPDPPFQ